MPLKIVRNDITKMQVDAVVNTANEKVMVGDGCDTAIYEAAGYDELLAERKKIGDMVEGQAAITPGFHLPAKYIIHAVSPLYIDGESGEEEKLRDCYRNSFEFVVDYEMKSVAFPLIATGSFGYPKEKGLRIAVDEINRFLLTYDIEVYLVVFDDKATQLGQRLYPDLEEYIDQNYVGEQTFSEYGMMFPFGGRGSREQAKEKTVAVEELQEVQQSVSYSADMLEDGMRGFYDEETYEAHMQAMDERMKHMTDTYSEYLLYLIETKGMTNKEVYDRASLDKKVFSKIKNNPDYHPKKTTALCLCIGAKLNLDETRDLLARAGYALSPCDKTDIIFSYFVENQIYDVLELDIQLEERGLPSIV